LGCMFSFLHTSQPIRHCLLFLSPPRRYLSAFAAILPSLFRRILLLVVCSCSAFKPKSYTSYTFLRFGMHLKPAPHLTFLHFLHFLHVAPIHFLHFLHFAPPALSTLPALTAALHYPITRRNLPSPYTYPSSHQVRPGTRSASYNRQHPNGIANLIETKS
jgi:hypothetical protein